MAMSMKAKKALVCKLAFPKLLIDAWPDHKIESGIAHTTITKNIVFQALFGQSATKVPSSNKINF